MLIKRNYKLGDAFPAEEFVQAAVERYFRASGFEIDTNGHVDLLCARPDGVERWHIEAKGKTSQLGLDFRTCLGQLVQQIRDGDTHYGIALPHLPAVLRHSVRVGLHYRALGIAVADGASWFWIGTHAAYDRLVG